MTNSGRVVIVGLGEVGKPLLELLSNHYETVGVDIGGCDYTGPVSVLHVCYPFEIRNFTGETARYIERFRPAVTVINSTVGVGTTRAVYEQTGAPVVNSPVRGKHIRMLEDMQKYTKFVGAIDRSAAEAAAAHFESAGLKSKILSTPEATELAKLTETTYFGVMIAWAQEVERYCDNTGADYDEVVSFYDEIGFFPRVKYFPGVIGGHCVMPNIEILRKQMPSLLLEAVRASNDSKLEREGLKNVVAFA